MSFLVNWVDFIKKKMANHEFLLKIEELERHIFFSWNFESWSFFK